MKCALFIFPLVMVICSCNNSGSNTEPVKNDTKTPADQTMTESTPENNPITVSGTVVTVEGKEIKLGGSLLVQKDKDKLQPGNDYLVMLTAPGGMDKESMSLNFLVK